MIEDVVVALVVGEDLEEVGDVKDVDPEVDGEG